MTSVSVVVATRDKAPRLGLTLACLAGQDVEDFEVVVVDDGSAQDTQEVLELFRKRLKLVAVAGPGRGRAAARNRGVQAASGDLLLFLDDDVVLPRRAAAAHVAAHGAGPAYVHGVLAEVIGLLRVHQPLSLPPYDRLLDPTRLRRGGLDLSEVRLVRTVLERFVAVMAAGEVPRVAPWLACIGANTSVPRAAVERVGGFDEAFGNRWGCEDLELGVRLDAAGLRAELSEAACAFHLSHYRATGWEEHAVNMQRFAARHPQPTVRALPALLGPTGSASAYLARVAALANGEGEGTLGPLVEESG